MLMQMYKASYMWKDYIWNPATWSCKNGKYLASIVDDSVMTCDKIIEAEETKIEQFLVKNATSKTKNFCILLVFLLITISLLIAVSIHCYLIKYWAKQKHLLPYYVINNKYFGINNIFKKKRVKKLILKFVHVVIHDDKESWRYWLW